MTVIIGFPKVRFDFGAINALPEELAALGVHRPLMITDRGIVDCGVAARVRDALPAGGGNASFDDIPENPTIAGVEAALEVYRAADCDGVVAVGGGSVIDSAKAIALLAGHPGTLADYHGHPERITSAAAPIIAVPTTAGTGSEVTQGAGIHPDPASRTAGVRSAHLQPKVAICDPELTVTLPPRLTAGTGMDALGHCLEGFLSPAVNPPVDAIALDGIARVVGHVERAFADGADRDARWQLMMAALEGGMAISKGLGAVHSLANTFGDRGLHHGALVTIAVPPVLRFYDAAIGDGIHEKMARLAAAMGVTSGADVADAIEALNARLELPANFAALGYPDGDRDEMAEDAAASFFRASPRTPTTGEYRGIIDQLLG